MMDSITQMSTGHHLNNNQRPGFDYIEIFAPTVRMPTIRVVLAIAALQDYHLRSIDISHAYLNGEMDCDVYMEQPEGFCEGDPRQTVCLLQRCPSHTACVCG